MLWVSVSHNLVLLQNKVNIGHLLLRQQWHTLQILNHSRACSRSRDRNDSWHTRSSIQRQDPSQCELGGSNPLPLGEFQYLFEQLPVLLHGGILELRKDFAEVTVGEVGYICKGPGKEPSAERRVGNDGDSKLRTDFGDIVLEDVNGE